MKSVRVALALLVFAGLRLGAQTGDRGSWDRLSHLRPGQPVEVINAKGESFKGSFTTVSEDSITIAGKQHAVSVPRPEVLRVRVRPARHLRYTLLGTAIGAAAGLALGAAGGESLAQSSGGDFANLKPAIVAGCGGAGAAIGAVIGSVLGNRGATVYRSK